MPKDETVTTIAEKDPYANEREAGLEMVGEGRWAMPRDAFEVLYGSVAAEHMPPSFFRDPMNPEEIKVERGVDLARGGAHGSIYAFPVDSPSFKGDVLVKATRTTDAHDMRACLAEGPVLSYLYSNAVERAANIGFADPNLVKSFPRVTELSVKKQPLLLTNGVTVETPRYSADGEHYYAMEHLSPEHGYLNLYETMLLRSSDTDNAYKYKVAASMFDHVDFLYRAGVAKVDLKNYEYWVSAHGMVTGIDFGVIDILPGSNPKALELSALNIGPTVLDVSGTGSALAEYRPKPDEERELKVLHRVTDAGISSLYALSTSDRGAFPWTPGLIGDLDGEAAAQPPRYEADAHIERLRQLPQPMAVLLEAYAVNVLSNKLGRDTSLSKSNADVTAVRSFLDTAPANALRDVFAELVIVQGANDASYTQTRADRLTATYPEVPWLVLLDPHRMAEAQSELESTMRSLGHEVSAESRETALSPDTVHARKLAAAVQLGGRESPAAYANTARDILRLNSFSQGENRVYSLVSLQKLIERTAGLDEEDYFRKSVEASLAFWAVEYLRIQNGIYGSKARIDRDWLPLAARYALGKCSKSDLPVLDDAIELLNEYEDTTEYVGKPLVPELAGYVRPLLLHIRNTAAEELREPLRVESARLTELTTPKVEGMGAKTLAEEVERLTGESAAKTTAIAEAVERAAQLGAEKAELTRQNTELLAKLAERQSAPVEVVVDIVKLTSAERRERAEKFQSRVAAVLGISASEIDTGAAALLVALPYIDSVEATKLARSSALVSRGINIAAPGQAQYKGWDAKFTGMVGLWGMRASNGAEYARTAAVLKQAGIKVGDNDWLDPGEGRWY